MNRSGLLLSCLAFAGCVGSPSTDVAYLGIPDGRLVRTVDLHDASLKKKMERVECVTEVIAVSGDFYAAQKKAGRVLFEERYGGHVYFSIEDLIDLPVQEAQTDGRVSISRSWVAALWRYRTPSRKEPNQPPQRNAGSRPFSRDSSVSETSSSLGPRG